jgi:hypothetical protein
MLADLFASWTVPAILTALVSGLGLGFILRSVRVDIHHVAFILACTAALWYVPQTVRLAVLPETANPIRQLGVMGIYLLWYVLPALLVARWRTR